MAITYKRPKLQAPGGKRTTSLGAVYNQTPAVIWTGVSRMESLTSMSGPPYLSQHSWDCREQHAKCGFCDAATPTQSYRKWRLAPGFSYTEGQNPSFTFVTPDFDQNYWLTQALADLTMDSTTIDPYLFTWELREVPRMLYDAYRILMGRAQMSDIVGFQLAINYGWQPLYNDLKTLVDLGLSVANMHAAIASQRERYQKGLGRYQATHTLSGASGIGSSNHTLHLESDTRVWFQSRWAPTSVPTLDDSGIRAFASSMGGLTSGLLTAWNALPWSFLIDYFLNVSKVLEAANGIQFKPELILIMAESNIKSVSYDRPSDVTIMWSEPSYKGRHRRRFVFNDPRPLFAWKPYPWQKNLRNISLLAVAQMQR